MLEPFGGFLNLSAAFWRIRIDTHDRPASPASGLCSSCRPAPTDNGRGNEWPFFSSWRRKTPQPSPPDRLRGSAAASGLRPAGGDVDPSVPPAASARARLRG